MLFSLSSARRTAVGAMAAAAVAGTMLFGAAPAADAAPAQMPAIGPAHVAPPVWGGRGWGGHGWGPGWGRHAGWGWGHGGFGRGGFWGHPGFWGGHHGWW